LLRELETILGDDTSQAALGDLEAPEEPEDDIIIEEAEREIVATLPKPDFTSKSGVATFFLGSMVLLPKNKADFEIYDGLQRLTTLTILTAVLRDVIRSDKSLSGRLHKHIELPGGVFKKSAFRLALPGKDKTLLTLVQPRGEAGKPRTKRSFPSTDVGRRIWRATAFLRDKLGDRDPKQLSRIANFLLDQTHVAVIQATEPLLARHIFITTNLYGVPLERHEVFKGQLLALAGDDDNLTDALQRQWDSLRERVGNTLEEFLIAFDMIERRKAQGTDCLGDLIDHIGNTYVPNRRLASFMGKLADFAGAWNELQEALKWPTGGPIGNHVWRLTFFKWREWQPLALLWYAAYVRARKTESGRTLRRFSELHRRCMAITLYGYDQRLRAMIFEKAVRLAVDKRNPLTPPKKEHLRALTFNRAEQDKVRSALSNALYDYEVRRSLMQWYEAELQGALADGEIRSATVEHVLPEAPKTGSQWLTDFPDEEERDIRYHSVGNLALMDKQENIDAGNRDFVDKSPILTKQSVKYRTLQSVVSEPKWQNEEIKKRAEALLNDILAKLNLPAPRSEWK
jgi:hypothetical protein